MTTINANYLVTVEPSVLNQAGSGLVLNGLLLSNGNRVPIGQVLSFPTASAVISYFGAGSAEANFANGGSGLGSGYFGGYNNATQRPGALLVTQFPTASVSAYLRGGNISQLALAALQAITGTLDITIDGTPETGSINLSAATSFSNAAVIIADTLALEGALVGTCTASITTTVMTVTGTPTGVLAVGQLLNGTGVTAGTYISSPGTGTGGAGTYNVSASQTVVSETISFYAPAVTFDSVSGAFVVNSSTAGAGSTIGFATGTAADSLLLTSATGAVTSQGAIAAVPGTFMSAVTNITTNWASFGSCFNPDNSGFTKKLAFSAWTNAQNNRYAYVAWDSDITATESSPATGCYGYALQQDNYSGTILNWEPTDTNVAAFVMGMIASINFSRPNGRITFAYRGQTGLVPGVTDITSATNLAGSPEVTGSFGNGYNFYGAIASANQSFQLYQRGTVSGPYDWIDTYINQIWLNSQFQTAALNYLASVNSFPYSQAGYAAFENAMSGVIQAGLTFGAYSGGGTLSSTQISEVNAAAGANIATTLQNQGWYFQVLDPSASVKASRGTPVVTFFYVDNGSVQSLNINSVVL